MSTDTTVVTGSFEHLNALAASVKELRSKGFQDITVYSPIPHEEIDEALGGRESKVSYFALSGAILGWMLGLALTVGTALRLPLVTGGKPIVSFVPFYVIGFELTILLGGLFTIFSFLRIGRLSRARAAESYNPRFAEDRFGIAVRCAEDMRGAVEEALRSSGAEEVSVERL